MDEMVVKIMVELLFTLALAIKELKRGRSSEFILADLVTLLSSAQSNLKKVFREKDFDAVLQRLDRLTRYEALTTAAHILEVIHGLVQGMRVVMDGEQTYFGL
jgi:hypothetical protein